MKSETEIKKYINELMKERKTYIEKHKVSKEKISKEFLNQRIVGFSKEIHTLAWVLDINVQ